jgi:hypothetical protein
MITIKMILEWMKLNVANRLHYVLAHQISDTVKNNITFQCYSQQHTKYK